MMNAEPSNPVSKTAFYCCGIRMLDAESPKPVCGDELARRFIDSEAERFVEEFRCFHRQNASTVARHRIIDDVLRERIQNDPTTRIVLVGAGFDTRAFRLRGGEWIEVDEPEIIAYKNAKLPAGESLNPLARVPVNFSRESLADRLEPYAGDNVVVVIEGVVMYLGEEQLRSTVQSIRRVLPEAIIVTDLMTRDFYRRYSKRLQDRFARFGAGFRFSERHPVETFMDAGYRTLSCRSIIARAIEAGTFRMPYWVFRWFFRTLREGYAVWVLKAE